jgi:Planctomycete cytochrome C
MHTRKIIISYLFACCVALLAIFSANACQHEPLGPADDTVIIPTPLPACDSGVVYFQNDIMPYINSSCAIPGCHDNIGPAAGIDLSSYDAIMNSKVLGVPVVIPGDVLNSRFCRAIYSLDLIFMPPLFNLQLPNKAKQDMVKWVEQGAQNNACDAVCDTSSYKYAADIAPLLRKYCSGCHYGDYASDGIYTTTYNRVKALVDSNNLLYKVITGTPGFKRMPQGNVVMPACDVIKVRKWIESGAPNN